MRLPPRYQAPAVLLALAGLVLAAGPFLVFDHVGETRYGHEVERVEPTECEGAYLVVNRSALSPEAREVLRTALETDGNVTLYGEGAPGFHYPTDVERLRARQYVRDGEACYLVVTTYNEIGPALGWLVTAIGVAVGALAVVLAGASYRLRRPRVAALGLVLLCGLPLAVPFGGVALPVLAGLLAAVWYGLGRLGWAGPLPPE